MIDSLKRIILAINEIDKAYKKNLLNKRKLQLHLEGIKELAQIKREINSKLKISQLDDINAVAENLLYVRAQLIDIETAIKDITILIEESVDKLLDDNQTIK